MIYLDYSATTPVNDEVLDSFNKICTNYIGNPNSLHKLGVESKQLIDDATSQIKNILKCLDKEIIYTSGSSESNNLAIQGIALKYQNRGHHIITTRLEHSSIYGPLNHLGELGFEIDFVKLDEKGLVDLEDLRKLMKDTTILVSIASVNSEIGLLQPVDEIGKIIHNYPKCYFHCDMTQSIGKFDISLDNIDLASFSAHKIYGLKGIGCLLKKQSIIIDPIIYGGKSTTNYRSGTPAVALIGSLAKALRLSYISLDNKYNHVLYLNNMIKDKMKEYNDIYINSNDSSIPHILNMSIVNIKPETMLHALEKYDIYISTQSACSSGSSRSLAVFELTKDNKRAESSIRISLSHLTTEEEIKVFLNIFDKCYRELRMDS